MEIDWKIRPHAVQANLTPLPTVRNIIAVASGKGGVGKSTTAVNLALALMVEGARVGILDADIYGPSQPQMLGSGRSATATSRDGKTFEPLEAFGLQAMSIGFLVGQDKPVIWRGPMVTQAVNQLMFQTNWRDLDYLIVDMPPGTGDTQLTVTSKVPVSGAVIVTTPQDIALLDARRGLKMFEKVNVRILGVVENMSTYVCSECGHEEPLFGSGGGQVLTEESGLPLLGELPLGARPGPCCEASSSAAATMPCSLGSRVFSRHPPTPRPSGAVRRQRLFRGRGGAHDGQRAVGRSSSIGLLRFRLKGPARAPGTSSIPVDRDGAVREGPGWRSEIEAGDGGSETIRRGRCEVPNVQ